MPRNFLSDVDVIAISLVDKGANQKRFYLKKQDDGDTLITLPASHRLVKSEDWSAVYCVVAEPGWEERPGRNAPNPEVNDVWSSDDEIRKAAHKFMRNGALVNKMHETLDPFGQIVENFVAPADFSINDEVIKAGSWVVAIEPTQEGRDKIESGEFTGISIQGSGVRTLEKSDPEGENMQDTEKQGLVKKFMELLGMDPVVGEPATVEKEGNEVANELTPEQLTEAVSKAVDEKLEKTNKDLSTLAQSVAQIAQTLAEGKTAETDPAQEVYHRLDDVAKSIDDIRSDVEKLATGHSAQPETPANGTVEKKDPLAGLLS